MESGTFVPITLGVPFRIHITASVPVVNRGGTGGGSAGGEIWLSLFDTQGQPVNIVEATSVVPEPGSLTLIGIAGVFAGLARLRLRK